MKNVLVNKFAYLMLLMSMCTYVHADYPGKVFTQRKDTCVIGKRKLVKKPIKVIPSVVSMPAATPVVAAPVVTEKRATRNVEIGLNRNLPLWVTIISPAQESANVTNHEVSGDIALSDSYELHGMRPFDKMNSDLAAKLSQEASTISQKANSTVVGVNITGYSAPSGNALKSERLSMERMLALKEYLRNNPATSKINVEVNWVAEDWTSLTEMIRKSDMMFKDAVLGVISNTNASQDREKVLSQLADGAPYRYMKDRFFPLLERIEYTVTYATKASGNAARVEPISVGGISLNSLFITAQDYAKDSQEYNDLMDLGARLFPDSPQANINAAAVALMRRNTSKARRYLDRFSTLPAALNNMGILCLLEGNNEKAELYLEMAVARGVSQAQEALSYLRRQ